MRNWVTDTAGTLHSALRSRRDSLDYSLSGRACSAANWVADMSEIRNSALRNRRGFLDCSLLGRAYSVANWAAGTFESLYSVPRNRCDCRDYPSLRGSLLKTMEARRCDNPDVRSSSMRRRDSRRLYSVALSARYSSSPSCHPSSHCCADSMSRHIRETTVLFRRNCAMKNKSAANSMLCCESSKG